MGFWTWGHLDLLQDTLVLCDDSRIRAYLDIVPEHRHSDPA